MAQLRLPLLKRTLSLLPGGPLVPPLPPVQPQRLPLQTLPPLPPMSQVHVFADDTRGARQANRMMATPMRRRRTMTRKMPSAAHRNLEMLPQPSGSGSPPIEQPPSDGTSDEVAGG